MSDLSDISPLAPRKADPWVKFRPNDWQGNDRIRLCSLQARGLLIELYCLAWKAQRIGYLDQPNGGPFENATELARFLAKRVNAKSSQITRSLSELMGSNLIISDEFGRVFIPEIVHLAAETQRARENGKRGGNPVLTGKSQQISGLIDVDP